MPSLSSYLIALPQYLLPQRLLASWMYRLTRSSWRPLKNALIKIFVRLYNVDLTEAASSDLGSYPDFNSFFARALLPGARPLDSRPGSVLSPVDGSVSALGPIETGHVENARFAAKGHEFNLAALLGGDSELASRFAGGHFITIYLSPRDYHRIHMPFPGRLERVLRVPGKLFAVNDSTIQVIPGVLSRNERAVAVFNTEQGAMALVLVGALFVGSITIQDKTEGILLEAGDEVGRFNMGSTVIALFAPNLALSWEASLGSKVQMGSRLGSLAPN